MEKGGMKGGREWCSLTWARRRPCPRMRASRRFQAVVSGAAIVVSIRGCSCPFVGVRVRSWTLVSRSCLFVGVRARSWALVSCSCPFVSVRGPCVAFVSARGPSCGVHGRSCGVRVRWWAFVSIGGRSSWRHGWCDVGPVSHVKEEEGGRGVVGLTWMHNAQRGTSSSPCTGLVTWRRGVVLVCCGVAVCRGLCEVDGGRWGRWLWATGSAGCRGW